MSNRARVQFECDGVAFDVGRLNLNDSFKGVEMLAKIIGPAIADISKGEAAVAAALLQQAGQFPALLAMFAPVAKVSRGPDGLYGSFGEGSFVDLKPFMNDVFTARLDLTCMFILHCVKNEFLPFIKSVSTGELAQAVASL